MAPAQACGLCAGATRPERRRTFAGAATVRRHVRGCGVCRSARAAARGDRASGVAELRVVGPQWMATRGLPEEGHRPRFRCDSAALRTASLNGPCYESAWAHSRSVRDHGTDAETQGHAGSRRQHDRRKRRSKPSRPGDCCWCRADDDEANRGRRRALGAHCRERGSGFRCRCHLSARAVSRQDGIRQAGVVVVRTLAFVILAGCWPGRCGFRAGCQGRRGRGAASSLMVLRRQVARPRDTPQDRSVGHPGAATGAGPKGSLPGHAGDVAALTPRVGGPPLDLSTYRPRPARLGPGGRGSGGADGAG